MRLYIFSGYSEEYQLRIHKDEKNICFFEYRSVQNNSFLKYFQTCLINHLKNKTTSTR